MALPKHRHSKTRRDKRRTHYKLGITTVVDCPHCKAPMLPHRACPSCGYYKKRSVVVVKSAS